MYSEPLDSRSNFEFIEVEEIKTPPPCFLCLLVHPSSLKFLLVSEAAELDGIMDALLKFEFEFPCRISPCDVLAAL